jgi:hypothetical protein
LSFKKFRHNPSLLLLLLGLLGEDLGVGVEAEHNTLVDKGVLLLDGTTAGDGVTAGSVERALDLRGVDETGEVGLRDDVGGEEEVALEGRGLGGGAVDAIEGLEGGRGPDDEAAEVTTGGKLEEVEGRDGAGLDTGDVAETNDELLAVNLGVVDDQGTTALAVAAATELALTGAELLGLLGLVNVSTSTDGAEERDGGGGLGHGGGLEELGVDDERDLRDGHDLVTAGEEERGSGGGGKSRADSVTLLALVNLDVPLAPDLGRGEHATGTAHVTEGGLTGTVSTTARDTGDTGDSATSSPRLGRGLVTGLLAHGVRLALVLGHAGVNVLHDIRADGSTEDGRDGVGRARGLTIFADDRDGRSGSHCEGIRGTLTCKMNNRI